MRILGGAAAAVTAHLAPGGGPAAGLQAPKTVILRARLSELVVPGEGHWQTAGMAQWCRRRVWWRPSWQERCAAGCVCPSPGQCAGVGHRLHGGGVELRRWTAKVAGGEDGWPSGAGVMPMSGGGWGPWPEASARGQALSPALTSQHLISPSSVSLSSRFCTGTSPDGRGSGGDEGGGAGSLVVGGQWKSCSGGPVLGQGHHGPGKRGCRVALCPGRARSPASWMGVGRGPGEQAREDSGPGVCTHVPGCEEPRLRSSQDLVAACTPAVPGVGRPGHVGHKQGQGFGTCPSWADLLSAPGAGETAGPRFRCAKSSSSPSPEKVGKAIIAQEIKGEKPQGLLPALPLPALGAHELI